MDRANYFRGGTSNCLVMRKLRSPLAARSTSTATISLEEAQRRLGESEKVISDMAEELSFCYESLSAIFRCSVELGRTHKLKEFSERLLTDLAQITSAHWFVLRLLSRDGSKLSVFTASDPSLRLPP